MNIPPTILSWALLPLSVLWLIAIFVHGFYFFRAWTFESVPEFWSVVFYIAGPMCLFIAPMLVTVRRRERTRFQRIDRFALTVTAASALAFAGSLGYTLMKLWQFKQQQGSKIIEANTVPGAVATRPSWSLSFDASAAS